MPASVDIISVGTLSRNRFWNDKGAVRNSHATTTLIRDDEATVLVDPSLPQQILEHYLDDRTGLTLDKIDTVFLTCFRPIHRRGIQALAHAQWVMNAAEIEAMTGYLEDVSVAADARGEEIEPLVHEELELLERIQPAPDQLTEFIHLFPNPGVTPGAASLLALGDLRTIAVVGDAIINKEYFAKRQAFEQHSDTEAAVQAIAELTEIADIIVPGHGDWILNL